MRPQPTATQLPEDRAAELLQGCSGYPIDAMVVRRYKGLVEQYGFAGGIYVQASQGDGSAAVGHAQESGGHGQAGAGGWLGASAACGEGVGRGCTRTSRRTTSVLQGHSMHPLFARAAGFHEGSAHPPTHPPIFSHAPAFALQEPDTSAAAAQALVSLVAAEQAYFPLGFAYGEKVKLARFLLRCADGQEKGGELWLEHAGML